MIVTRFYSKGCDCQSMTFHFYHICVTRHPLRDKLVTRSSKVWITRAINYLKGTRISKQINQASLQKKCEIVYTHTSVQKLQKFISLMISYPCDSLPMHFPCLFLLLLFQIKHTHNLKIKTPRCYMNISLKWLATSNYNGI